MYILIRLQSCICLYKFQVDQENGPTSPASEEGSLTPKVIHSPKYQMFLGSDHVRNGDSGPGGPTDASGALSNSNLSHWRSMESLSLRDWESSPNKVRECVEWTCRSFLKRSNKNTFFVLRMHCTPSESCRCCLLYFNVISSRSCFLYSLLR